jgi:hypothetical protein
MKKNKLFLISSILIVICLFATAAACNLCGVPVEIGETTETAEVSKETKTEQKQIGQTQQESSGQEQPTEEVVEPESADEGEPDPETVDVIPPEEEDEASEEPNHPPVVTNIIIEDSKGSLVSGTILNTDKKYKVFAEISDEDGLDDIMALTWFLSQCSPGLMDGTFSDRYTNPTTLLSPSQPLDCLIIFIRVWDYYGELGTYEKQVEVRVDLGV